MKTLVKISIIGLGLLAAIATQAKVFEATTEVVPSKYKNLMVLKTDKKLVGAKVEVLYSNGDVVTTQRLRKRKLIIDFCDVKAGNYIVRLTKGDEKEEYLYTRGK
ncbi:MAG: hypothetical protein L0Y35_03460 [Flammeovirgaceae bacterium]|nr:hypothetical protein [Flammeovirgaceae bacterium]